MKHIATWATASLLLCAVSAANAQSLPVCYDDAQPGRFQIDKYEVDVKAVDICTNSSCSEKSSVVSSTSKMDIANLSSPVFPAADIPFGTYSHLRIELGPNITVSGKAVMDLPGGGQVVCVSRSGLSGVGFINAATAGWTAGPDGTPGDMTLTIPSNAFGSAAMSNGNFVFTIQLPSKIEVAEGFTFPAIDLQFTAIRDAFGIYGVYNAGAGGYACGAVLGTPDIKLQVSPPMSSHQDLVPTKINACSNLVGS